LPHSNVYACSSLLGGRPARGRGAAADACSLGILSLDFNVGQIGHATDKPRPASKNEIYRLLEELPSPTGIVDTGNGLLPIWTLAKPLIIGSEGDRKEADRLFKSFQGQIRRIAKAKFAWDLDATADLARLVRIAGTWNHKTAPPKPVVFFPTTEGGPVPAPDTPLLSHDDMMSIVAAFEVGKPGRSTSRASRSEPVVGADADAPAPEGKAELGPILAGCAFMDHWRRDATTLKEPDWKAGIDIAVHCNDGRRLIHDASRPYPKYSVSETDTKIDQATMPPRTCENIEVNLGFEGCSLCPYRGKFRSPIALGRSSVALASLGRRYVYVALRDAFYDLGAVV
jgi:hypothetical protein